MDTGVGEHPWFAAPNDEVARQMELADGTKVGVDVTVQSSIDSDPEDAGAISDPMTGSLATHAGHGTFIAGLLRQICPEALITILRVMGADGVVPEDVLDLELTALALHQRENPAATDALVLSLGYYVEDKDDQHYTAGLHKLLVDLASIGITTFASAGNDATKRKSYPAAFAVDAPFDGHGVCALVSVAALNPDGTVALFSNDGDWVIAQAAGANVVSTAPTRIQGGLSAAASVDVGGRVRSAIDPDEFSGGFATWSGTSFAAPILAGKFLALLADLAGPIDLPTRQKLVTRLRRR
jgi:subtilisin family serine protease